jgi:hypothetical protein
VIDFIKTASYAKFEDMIFWLVLSGSLLVKQLRLQCTLRHVPAIVALRLSALEVDACTA